MGGGFLIAAAALKTPTRDGYNAQGINLKLYGRVKDIIHHGKTFFLSPGGSPGAGWRLPSGSPVVFTETEKQP